MDVLERLAELIRTKNRIDDEIAGIIGRPAQIGHVGEYIASNIFGIKLEESAARRAIDGHFMDGPLAGRTVNIKWYGKMEGLLDITPNHLPDYYLVMAGPKSGAISSRGKTRPWLISAVYLFDARHLVGMLNTRGVKIGVATSVAASMWEEAQIYPIQQSKTLVLSRDQRKQIELFEGSNFFE